MNRNFIFAFVLLALLNIFTVNAFPYHLFDKRTVKPVNAFPYHLFDKRSSTSFNDCPIQGAATLSVTMNPDPPVAASTVSFSVFGTLDKDITAGTTFLAIVLADATGKKILIDVHFQVFSESFKSGSTFKIQADNIPTPDEFPDTYTIGIGVGDPDLGNPITPLVFSGCTYAVINK